MEGWKWVVLLAVVLIICWYVYDYVKNKRPIRPQEEGFKYVYVHTDGQVRELGRDEISWFTKKFEPSDLDRPKPISTYEKESATRYRAGYINRRRIPKDIEIQKLVDGNEENG